MAEETVQVPFTLRDGLTIALYEWPRPARRRPRAVVLLVHGLGEHAWRYDHLAIQLNAWGFCVRAFDQRGHGDSYGKPGVLPSDDALLDDLKELVEDTREHMCERWGCPLIVLGHSMGGLVAALFVLRQLAPVDGLVLSSPALDPGLRGLQKSLVEVLYRVAPNWALPSGLDTSKISHDEAVVRAYQKDRRVHNRISARLARFVVRGGTQVMAGAPTWRVPTLLMYAGDDHLVQAAASLAFSKAAPPEVVTSHCLEGQYHEVFNEKDNRPAFAHLKAWLGKQPLA